MLSQLLVNTDRYPLTVDSGRRFYEMFAHDQLVVLPQFFKLEAFSLLAAEVHRMEQSKKRRDLLMQDSDNTPRKMSTLGGIDVTQMSTIIPMLYFDDALLDFISGVVGERVFLAPDLVENHVCNFLHEVGDIHGGHVDTYPFAFNTMIEAPAEGTGGLLTMVKNSTAIEELDDEQKAQQIYIPTGDCYVLRADKAVHRVSPLNQPGRRTVINFAYADEATADTLSYSSSVLYGDA